VYGGEIFKKNLKNAQTTKIYNNWGKGERKE